MREQLNIQISDTHKARLYEIAESLGYTRKVGPATVGNLSAMFEAIADGTLELSRKGNTMNTDIHVLTHKLSRILGISPVDVVAVSGTDQDNNQTPDFVDVHVFEFGPTAAQLLTKLEPYGLEPQHTQVDKLIFLTHEVETALNTEQVG
jgi:hypothetical protein